MKYRWWQVSRVNKFIEGGREHAIQIAIDDSNDWTLISRRDQFSDNEVRQLLDVFERSVKIYQNSAQRHMRLPDVELLK